jgi:hypothetical protein
MNKSTSFGVAIGAFIGGALALYFQMYNWTYVVELQTKLLPNHTTQEIVENCPGSRCVMVIKTN